MGGRKRRLGNFERRAAQFSKALLKPLAKAGGRYLPVMRYSHNIAVGGYEFRRLMRKPRPQDLKLVQGFYKGMKQFYGEKNIVPAKYILVEPRSDIALGVQEYFHRPSLNAVLDFFRLADSKREFMAKPTDKQFNSSYQALKTAWHKFYSRTDYLLCKKLLGEFPVITYENVSSAMTELEGHTDIARKDYSVVFGPAKRLPIEAHNVVVLGIHGGRIRLAVVDY